ncbi:MAG: hypothetical protein Fur0034_20090 [Desulfuromonadia bacterium]
MRRFILIFISILLTACSLPPERPVTKRQLLATGIYRNFKIKESPESVLAALNRDGEVVLDTTYKGKPLFLKIMATAKGLELAYVEK